MRLQTILSLELRIIEGQARHRVAEEDFRGVLLAVLRALGQASDISVKEAHNIAHQNEHLPNVLEENGFPGLANLTAEALQILFDRKEETMRAPLRQVMRVA